MRKNRFGWINSFYYLKMKKQKIGLALSSGGSRGGVHIGVIKTLREAGIPISCLSGSSAGAVVAACYACGTLDRLEEFLEEIRVRDILTFFDLRISKESFAKGEKVMAFLRWVTDDKNFSDLKIPVYIMASDIKGHKEVVITRGKVARALFASMCVPPLFKPVQRNGKLLVDGGLFHLLPVEILKKEKCDFIIASNIESKKFVTFEHDGRAFKGYELLKEIKNKMTKYRTDLLFRSFEETVNKKEKDKSYNLLWAAMTCLETGITAPIREEKLADYLIKTDVNGVGVIELYKAKDCIKRGEIETKKHIRKIKKLLEQ